jgi:hypothetical protein
MQKTKPLRHHLRVQKIDTGRVATRPREANDKTDLDWIFTDAEYDRNSRSYGLGCDCGEWGSGRGDDGYATTDKVNRQCWQTIVLALQPVVLDRHVTAVDVTGFAKALAERSSTR